jgi:ABC-type nitrate/sulfonate/bicarbonate transport system permease component
MSVRLGVFAAPGERAREAPSGAARVRAAGEALLPFATVAVAWELFAALGPLPPKLFPSLAMVAAALDAMTREEMQRLLVEVWQETRKTVVCVTHNVAEAVYLADRIVVLTPHPGTVKAALEIGLPRMRDPLRVDSWTTSARSSDT